MWKKGVLLLQFLMTNQSPKINFYTYIYIDKLYIFLTSMVDFKPATVLSFLKNICQRNVRHFFQT